MCDFMLSHIKALAPTKILNMGKKFGLGTRLGRPRCLSKFFMQPCFRNITETPDPLQILEGPGMGLCCAIGLVMMICGFFCS